MGGVVVATSIRVILVVLCGACGALSQSDRPSPDLPQQDSPSSSEVQRQEIQTRSLPDAPSTALHRTHEERFQAFIDQERWPSTLGSAGTIADVMLQTERGYLLPGVQPKVVAFYTEAFTQNQSSVFLGPMRGMTFAPAFGQARQETNRSATDLKSYGHYIPWAGPVILRISQQARTHPHLTRALQVVQPRF